MKTRDITTEERTELDTAWNKYHKTVDELHKNQPNDWPKKLDAAYAEYKETMNALNIISTLAGYRVKIECSEKSSAG